MPSTALPRVFNFVTGDWRPYIYEENGSVKLDKPGFSIEIVQEAFKYLGHGVRIKSYSFARQIALTETGEVDGLIGLYQSDAPQLRYPKEPIALSINCFFMRPEETWEYSEVESLKTIKLGVIKGYTYGFDALDQYIDQKKVDEKIISIAGSETEMMSRLFQLLEAKRIDVFP